MKNGGNSGYKGNKRNKAGYEYLLAYKITVPIYDYTITFCKRWINPYSRTKDQMEQAARSGMQNTAEGDYDKHMKEGGFSEELYRERVRYRGDWGNGGR